MDVICYACGRGEQPENTLEGIRHCQMVNPDWRIEMDIQLTKDGELVLFHDDTTQRITGKQGEIKALTLKEAQALNVGHFFQQKHQLIAKKIKMPRLEAVFLEFPTAKFLLDIHTNDLRVVEKIIQLIENYRLVDQVIIVSHYDLVVDWFKEKRPKWVYGAPTLEAKKIIYGSFLFLDQFFPISSDILMIPQYYGKINVLTKRVIGHIKKRKKKIWVWLLEGKNEVVTIGNKNEFNRMMQIGADGIFSEYPEQLSKSISNGI